MELQVGVKILFVNSAGKYLLLRRNQKKYPEMAVKWDIPGGRINPGTPLIENLKREVKEETGFEFTTTPKLISAQDILRIADKHVVRLTYLGKIEGEPILSDEHDIYKWFTKDELRAIPREEQDIYFQELVDSGVIFE